MDVNEFRDFGKAAIDFIADYLENIRERPVLSSVSPGYLQHLIPQQMPEHPERWQDIMSDLNRVIVPGITNWQSPNFHAYFPAHISYSSIIGEMISASFGIIGFSWLSSPACTELEVIMMDWLGKLLDIPQEFLNSADGPGGGVIQGTASESILIAAIATREQSLARIKAISPELSESDIRGKFIAYSSELANGCVEKSSHLAVLPMRLLKTDENGSLRGDVLQAAIDEDLAKGYIPIFCVTTSGTTGTCSFDNLEELGPICNKHKIWLHIDAAYAGGAMCCPEYRHLMNGIEYADSFNVSLHKWMMVNFDCCAMWMKNVSHIVRAFAMSRLYLAHKYQGVAPDYRNWQIQLGRRFRALKVWFVFRTFGAEGMRKRIRVSIALAKRFENYVRNDDRFEIALKQNMGLVCFRLKGDCSQTAQLLDRITERKQIFMIRDKFHGKLLIRFVVAGMNPNEKDIDFAWQEISSQATEFLNGR